MKILDGAKQDFFDGFWFYEKQSKGVGRYFRDSLMADIESLHGCAGVHEKQSGCYRMIARRFPYAIYYQLGEEIIRIHAILDCRRNPAWIHRRLKREQ
jgi:plasmid stabilization system protein ParE